MKQRNNGQQYGDRISMKGVLPQWKMCGFVQMVHSNGSTKYPADFVRFQIRPKGKENDESAFGCVFAVTVPDSLGIQLERGDKVYIEGSITSWKNDNGYRLELVATKVTAWDGLFKEERQRIQNGEQIEPAPQKSAKKRLGEADVVAEQLERRGAMIYPAGTAPKEKKPEETETVDFGEYEDEIIGNNAPVPF